MYGIGYVLRIGSLFGWVCVSMDYTIIRFNCLSRSRVSTNARMRSKSQYQIHVLLNARSCRRQIDKASDSNVPTRR